MARLATAVVLTLGPVALVGVWVAQPSDQTVQAERTFQRIGSSVQVLYADSLTVDRIGAFARRLPGGHGLLTLSVDTGSQRPILRAPCPVLRDLGLPCSAWLLAVPAHRVGDVRAQEMLRWLGDPEKGLLVQEEKTPGRIQEPDALVVVKSVRDTTPGWATKNAAFAAFPIGPEIEALGAGWRLATSSGRYLEEWVTLLATVGMVIALLAGLISAMNEYLKYAMTLPADDDGSIHGPAQQEIHSQPQRERSVRR